jgi:ATP-dependent protease HslVU (ClpYQ) peptidase subunit
VTVIVACRTADGSIVLGADGQVTAGDETLEGTKLSVHPFQNGKALIGMAARDANLGFMRKVELFRAMRDVSLDQDPVEVIQRRMASTCENLQEDVQILCAVASRAIESPKLLRISNTEVIDLSGSRFCCVGSGNGAAHAFLKQTGECLQSLRHVQIAVCVSAWLAKQTDPLCGGDTDIWWLNSDLGTEMLESERIRSWEDYFKTSLPNALARWIEGVP